MPPPAPPTSAPPASVAPSTAVPPQVPQACPVPTQIPSTILTVGSIAPRPKQAIQLVNPLSRNQSPITQQVRFDLKGSGQCSHLSFDFNLQFFFGK